MYVCMYVRMRDVCTVRVRANVMYFMCVRMYVRIYVCNVCMYVFMYVCMYVYICICIVYVRM